MTLHVQRVCLLFAAAGLFFAAESISAGEVTETVLAAGCASGKCGGARAQRPSSYPRITSQAEPTEQNQAGNSRQNLGGGSSYQRNLPSKYAHTRFSRLQEHSDENGHENGNGNNHKNNNNNNNNEKNDKQGKTRGYAVVDDETWDEWNWDQEDNGQAARRKAQARPRR